MIEILLALATASVRPSDFAWSASVPTPSSGGLQWVVLTDSVYLLSKQPDHSDIALFSDQGKLVPWAPHSIPGSGSRILELHLEHIPGSPSFRNEHDTIVHPERWLAEVPGSEKGLWSLGASLDLAPDSGVPFVGEVELETSADLAGWTRVGGGGICRIGTGERGILRDSLSAQGRVMRYVRVSTTSNSPIALRSLRVSFEYDSLRSVPPRRGVRIAEGAEGPESWDYDLGGDFPIDRLGLEIGPQSILEARILARHSDDSVWSEIDRTSFFQVDFQGRRLATPPLTLSGASYRYWRIVPLSTTLAHPPRMRAEWTLVRNLFLAAPNQAVRLAVGSRRLDAPRPGHTEDLFSSMGSLSEHGLLQAPEVAPAGFIPSGSGMPAPVTDHSKWILALLVVAALSTLGFAWKVWKESIQPPRP